MKTATTLMTIVIIFLVTVMNVQAGTISAKNADVDIQLSGYMVIDAPMHTGETYDARFIRIRTDAYVLSVDQLRVTFEYDFVGGLSYGYAAKSIPLLGGKFTATVGRLLTAVGCSTPGPNSILFRKWSGGFDDYTIKTVGVMTTFERSNFTLRAMHAKHSQVSVKYGFVTAMWQEKTAMGFILDSPFDISLLDIIVIASVPEHGEEQYTIRNYSHLTEKLSFNQMIDFGKKDILTVGFAYEYAKKSYLKGYVDLTKEMHPEYFLEFTCSF